MAPSTCDTENTSTNKFSTATIELMCTSDSYTTREDTMVSQRDGPSPQKIIFSFTKKIKLKWTYGPPTRYLTTYTTIYLTHKGKRDMI